MSFFYTCFIVSPNASDIERDTSVIFFEWLIKLEFAHLIGPSPVQHKTKREPREYMYRLPPIEKTLVR